MAYQNPKATRDFYPSEMEARKQVFARLKTMAENYGFREVETPVVEYTNLFTDKSGDEIKSQLFNLEKKGEEELSLRPELTPAVARMFIAKQKELPKPVKWYYLQKMWRYEKPQQGRLREFYQFGVELFGSDKTEADADVINLAIDLLSSLGLTKKDFVIKVNNRKLLAGLLESLKLKNQEDIFRVIDKYRKLSKDDFLEELKKAKADKKQSDKIVELISLKKLSDFDKAAGGNEMAAKGLEELKRLFELMKQYGKQDCVEFDLSIARGLAYYTGIVFECYDKDESLRAIFGGGRYDNLVELFKGMKEPATGFAIGDVTLQLLLEKKGLWPKPEKEIDYYIANVDEASRKKAVEIADRLRKRYSVEIDLMGKKLAKQFDYANTIKAKKVIVIGEDEIKSGKLTVKDMKTGKEEKIDASKLA